MLIAIRCTLAAEPARIAAREARGMAIALQAMSRLENRVPCVLCRVLVMRHRMMRT